LVTKGDPCTGIDKNISFRAKEEIELSGIIAFRVDPESQPVTRELRHCGRTSGIKRKNHGEMKTLEAKPSASRHKQRDKNVFVVKFLCIGNHDREASPLVVFIQATSTAGEILRSKPFILCSSRLAKVLHDTYNRMKPALEAATEALSKQFIPAPENDPPLEIQETEMPLSTGPGPENQIHPEPNPPQPAQSLIRDDESDALYQGPIEDFDIPWYLETSPTDFHICRFAN
jgi:hypothetical protein